MSFEKKRSQCEEAQHNEIVANLCPSPRGTLSLADLWPAGAAGAGAQQRWRVGVLQPAPPVGVMREEVAVAALEALGLALSGAADAP